MDKEADFVPVEVGENVTVTVCAVPPELIVKEVGDAVNSVASVPVTVMPDTVNAALPVLDTVNVDVPEVPTSTLSNERDVVDREITGADG